MEMIAKYNKKREMNQNIFIPGEITNSIDAINQNIGYIAHISRNAVLILEIQNDLQAEKDNIQEITCCDICLFFLSYFYFIKCF